MRSVMVLFLFVAASVIAQGQIKDQAEFALNSAGCGPSQVSFDVTVDKSQHPLIQPETGKALIYVINGTNGYISKVGADGTWVGANRPKSYFSFSVDPGDHHICASMQGDHFQGTATSFTAVAGQVLYFRLSLKEGPYWQLKAIDPAQGQFLIASSALSASQPKK